jgi:hypothetical protein
MSCFAEILRLYQVDRQGGKANMASHPIQKEKSIYDQDKITSRFATRNAASRM